MNKNTFKNIGAVVAGFLTVVVLSTAADQLMVALSIFPPVSNGLFVTWMLAVALAYRCVFTLAGGFVTAALAPERPMRLVAILGVLGLAGGIAGIVAGWNLSAHWYPIAIAVTSFPLVWFGGTLKKPRAQTSVAA